MKRVAIPIVNNKLSEYFGACSFYNIYEINGNHVSKSIYKKPAISAISELPAWAVENGITDIITYKISSQIISLFSKHKINLYVGISINEPEQLIEEYLNENLVSDHTVIEQIINE